LQDKSKSSSAQRRFLGGTNSLLHRNTRTIRCERGQHFSGQYDSLPLEGTSRRKSSIEGRKS
jgi:hypothetical protein